MFFSYAAPGLARLLSSINTDETHTASLRDFCAAYMDVEVSSALMTQADRRGFSLIAKPVDAAKGEDAFQCVWTSMHPNLPLAF